MFQNNKKKKKKRQGTYDITELTFNEIKTCEIRYEEILM